MEIPQHVPELAPKESPAATKAKAKARAFISATFADTTTPEQKAQRMQEHSSLQMFDFVLGDRVVKVPYMLSGNSKEAQGKPTVVMFPGIFQQVKQLPTDIATIVHTFGVRVIAVDYASFAQNKGMEDVMRGLPQLLAHIEGNQTPPPPRIFIGESLGGLVAQTMAFQAERDNELRQRLNLQQLVLSHTIPPQRINPIIQRAITFFERYGRRIPFPIGRAGVEAFSAAGRGLAAVRQVFAKDQSAIEADRELAIIQEILRGEKDVLTFERAMGYIATSASLLAMSRPDDKTTIPTSVVLSAEDKIFRPIPPEEWQKHFPGIQLTILNGTRGHATPDLQKNRVLLESIVPALAETLPAAE